MTRTFAVLAALLGLLLLATFGVGWWSFSTRAIDGDAASLTFKNNLFIAHFYLGLATAILNLLVHCLIFTYFLGTGRWIKEVGIAYRLDDGDLPKATRELKRRVFPAALYAMLVGIATAAAGAGVDIKAWPWYVHAALGTLTLLVNIWAFRVEFQCLSENARVLTAVLTEVDRIREEQGLVSNAEALAQVK